MDAKSFQQASGVSLSRAQMLAPHITAATMEFRIADQAELAAFIAQTGHETMGFTRFRELWGPTSTQRGYEGRKDLGNTQPGDGKRYMGRGMIQITGRTGYAAASKSLGLDLVAYPEMLEDADLAATSAAWWWLEHGCGALLKAQGFEAVTRRINGGLNGLDDRIERWARAKAALGVAP